MGVPDWIAERRRIAFHGTGDPGIESFEPRGRSTCTVRRPEGRLCHQRADLGDVLRDRGRDRYEITLNNGCIFAARLETGVPARRTTTSRSAAKHYRPGPGEAVPLLPARGELRRAAVGRVRGHRARVPQLASPVSVVPFARLRVSPGDFPLSRANSRPRRRTPGRVRPSRDDGKPVARLTFEIPQTK